MKRLLLLFVLVAAVFALPAQGGKYSPALSVSPSTVQAGDHFNVSGCGYNADFGYVLVSVFAASYPTTVDGSGCISVTDIPALSGDTLPAGSYPVSAYQQVHGSRFSKVAEATLTVIS